MKKLVTTFLFSILMCTISYAQPLSGNYYIPKGVNPQGYDSLSLGVAALNINGCTGLVNFILDADTLRDTSFIFNASLSAVNNVVIKPAPGRNVVLIVTARPTVGNGPFMIGFLKGYVTFDGSNNGTNSRNLIVTTEQVSPVVDVPFSLNNADADSITLKNLIIKNIFTGQTNFRYGAVINDLDGVWGFRVENCQIGTAERPVRRDGLAPWGLNGDPKTQFIFWNNEIYAGTRGVATLWFSQCEIIGNTINILPTTGGNTNVYMHGIYLTGASGVSYVYDNVVNCLEKSNNATGYVIGIAFAGNNADAGDSVYVVNNMVNVGAANETRNIYGIGLRSAQTHGNLKIYHNTILLNDNVSTLTSHAIGNHTNGTGPVKIDLKNNIVINNHSGSTASSVIGLIPVTSVLTSNFNQLVSNQNFVNYQGTAYATLVAWQVASGQDANSFSTTVTFATAPDLHLAGGSIQDPYLAGTPIGISTDIDGDTRSSTFPYKGADESTAFSIKTLNLTALIQGLYTPTLDGTMIEDTVTVELRNNSSPFSLVDKRRTKLNSFGSGSLNYLFPQDATDYYIAVKHRNAVETWSKDPQQFTGGSLSYDFTAASNKAYSDGVNANPPMKQASDGKWCFWSGEVTNNYFVEYDDLLQVYNFYLLALEDPGYYPEDITGNEYVEYDDVLLVYNNYSAEIWSQNPLNEVLTARPIKVKEINNRINTQE